MDKIFKLQRAGREIARRLVVNNFRDNQEFWNRNWPLLRLLLPFEADLKTCVRRFSSSQSRSDAWALIIRVDMIWQIIRKLGDLTGKDEELKTSYLPDNWKNNSPDDPHGFHSDAHAFDLLNRVFRLHSILRHPSPNLSDTLELMLTDPWQAEEVEFLLDAASVAASMLIVLRQGFSPSNGFEGDCIEKQNRRIIAERC